MEPAFIDVYYVRGAVPKNLRHWPRFYVKDPPTAGHARQFALPGKKSVTLFCPVTFQSNPVPRDAGELRNLDRPVEYDPERLAGLIAERWHKLAAMGFQRDYDTAARVLRLLGAEVPQVEIRRDEGEERPERKPKGKPLDLARLKPIKRASKRGKVAAFFLPGRRSVREAMAELEMGRNNILSHLHCIQRDHGVGYELSGDSARLLVPEGQSIFDDQQPKG